MWIWIQAPPNETFVEIKLLQDILAATLQGGITGLFLGNQQIREKKKFFENFRRIQEANSLRRKYGTDPKQLTLILFLAVDKPSQQVIYFILSINGQGLPGKNEAELKKYFNI